jgi:hypothetical protein
MKEDLVQFIGVLERRIGRSKFSVENSRSPESRQILQRSREVMASILQVQAQEKSDCRIQVDKGHWITREFSLREFAS